MPETVDFRTRTTSEMNPRKGQNPSPFIFDFNSFSSNQNPKNLSSSSSSSFSFSEPVKPSLKTSSVSEDSGKTYTVKPRLVKHRRHLVNPRGKPLAMNSSEGKMDADFNPFRSKYLDSSNLEDVGKKNKGLPDQFRNESPFVLNPKSKGVDFSFDSTKEEGFVFGNNRADDSIENTNLASGFDGIGDTMLPDEMRKLRVARGTGDNGGNSRTSQNDKDASFNFKFGESGNLDLNSNANTNSGLSGITSTALPDETRKLKTASGMGDNGSRRSIEEEVFFFGTNRTGSGENPNLNSGSGGISGSMLPEEMRKLKIVNGMGSNGVSTHTSKNDKDAALSFKSGKTGNLNSESNSNSKSGLVGITGTVLPDEMRKLKIASGTGDNGGNSSAEGFVFGTNWASGSGDNPHSSRAPDGIHGSMLPNEAGKSKVTSEMGDKASSNCTFQNAKNAAFTFKFFERQNLGLNSNSVFDGIAASVLPNEMRKLKIASRKGDYGSTNSTSQNAKNVDFSFKFGERGNSNSNTNNGSDEIVGSILPDEMQKLKIASETGDNRAEGYTSQNVEDLAFSFKFGERGNSNSNSNSTSSSGGVTGTMLSDEVKQLNIGSGTRDNKGNNCTSQNAKDASFTLNFGERRNFGDASEKCAFIFGDNGGKIPVSNENSMGGLGGNNVSVLPDELRKLKIGSTLKDSSRGASIAIFPGSGKPSISQVNSWDSDTGDGSSFRKDKDSTFHSKAGESVMFGPSNVSEKNAFVFGSNMDESSGMKDSTTFVHMGSRLPDEMRKLNIGSRTRDSEGRRQKATGDTHIRSTRLHNSQSAQSAEGSFSSAGKTEKGFSSSRSTSEEMESENLEARVPDNLAGDGTIPTTFTFQAKNLGDGLTVDPGPSVEPKVDSKSSVFVGPSSSSSSSSSLSSPSSLSMGHGIQSASNIFAGFQIGNKSELCFGITGDGSGYMNPEILKQEPSSLLKEQVFSTPREEPFTFLIPTLDFSAKGGVVKNSTPKKRRGRVRHSASVHQRDGQNFAMKEKNLPEHPEPGDCSPMDFSPYEETLATDECSRGTSVASDECVHRGANNMSIDSQQDIPAESRGSKPLPREELNEENFDFWFKGHNLGSGCSESVSSGTWSSSVECSFSTKDYCDSITATIGSMDDSDIATTKVKADFCNPKIEKPRTDGGEKFSFSLKSEDVNESNFTFAASPYSQGQSSRGRHHYKKKHGLKVGQDTSSSTPTAKLHSASPFAQLFPVASSSSQQGPVQVEPGVESDKKKNTFVDKGPEVGKEFMATHVPCNVPPAQTINSNMTSVPTASVTATALEACEKWRLRGNQAYANGDLSRAEDYYTRGANSFPPSETSRNCIKAIMLCYSNRAATRMSLGRMREALTDCMMAAAIDPSFLRVQLRAANCHLALGEIEDALKQFKKCAESENDPSSDKKIIADASDGLQKAQQVAEYMDQSAELLRQRTSVDATNALDIITEALLISPYSELLLEMKAEALLVLQKYEEVIQLCEQTQDSAAKNSSSTSMNTRLRNVDDSASDMSSVTWVWRSHLISKSYFQLGRLEEALDLIQKHEMDPLVEKNWSRIQDSLGEFAATVRELLRHKAAGNEAFQAGRHLEAVEHYTAALTCNVESRPFTAICFCNRAAAYQALGQITDAIADCSLAIALDPNYPKAISRRATLHEMIRDYGQTQNNLQRLILLLEKQIEDRANQSGILSRSGSSVNDLKQARLRLAAVEEEARKEIPLDMYLILGIEASGSASDVKKAYRKAALRHHPDKASQFLARNENGDDKLWKEIAVEVHKDADRLFKMIGEAYAIISDPIKRSRYDIEEDIRNVQKKGTGSSTSQASADGHGYSFERSSGSSRRQWKAYGAQHHQWSDSNRYS